MTRRKEDSTLSTDLRKVVASNLRRLMDGSEQLKTATALGKASQVGRRTVDRVLTQEVAANLDTLWALCTALEVQPWELVTDGNSASILNKIFTKPIPDSRLGSAWTRPDRKPILQGNIARQENRTSRYSVTSREKLKSKR